MVLINLQKTIYTGVLEESQILWAEIEKFLSTWMYFD